MPGAGQAKARASYLAPGRHPAAAAARDRRFGAYLGCPERDRD